MPTATPLTGRAIQVAGPNQPLELVIRPVADPPRGHVRIRVQACGICHSDVQAIQGLRPGIPYPIVPGHEVVGIIDALGEEVIDLVIGQRVGLGWYGGHCRMCEPCRRGDFVLCQRGQVPGLTYDGGYADYVIAPQEAVARVPDELSSAEAAPLLCAGITTYNALRHAGAQAGDLVAVLGVGGLGHLAVQFAARMGYRTVAIARGADKKEPSLAIGARHYIDSTAQNVAESLLALGGAKVILATVTDGPAMTAAMGGLGFDGTFMIVGVSMDPIQVSPVALIRGRQSVRGWASGASIDSEDTLRFSALSGVRPRIERYPLERAAEGYARMMSGKARFRVVLETGA